MLVATGFFPRSIRLLMNFDTRVLPYLLSGRTSRFFGVARLDILSDFLPQNLRQEGLFAPYFDLL